jgi:hypothetical protein
MNGAVTIHPMPCGQTRSVRIYATPAYCEGYGAGCKAAHLRRADINPYPLQDLRHLGWMDAFYDSWSARRVEISRAAEHRDIFHAGAIAESAVPIAERNSRTGQ